MEIKLFVALTLSSLALASQTPEEVKAELAFHVESKIFSLLSIPGVSRAGGGIKCYDKYLPLITAATENSKVDTAACISRASSRREDELNKVKQQRENLNLQVRNVENTLSSCLNKSDDLEYFKCLKENSANMQLTIIEVGKASTSWSDNLSSSYKNIGSVEDACIKNVIAKSKSVSNELLIALQNCLMNGFDSDSDGGSDGGSDGNSDGSSDGGSDAGSDSGSDGSFDDGFDGGSNEGSGGGSNRGSDGGSDSGSDGGSVDGSDGSSNEGSGGGSNGGSNSGSDGSPNGGSDSGSDGGSDGTVDGGSEASSDGVSNNGSDNRSANGSGSDSSSDGSVGSGTGGGLKGSSDTDANSASDSGVIPDGRLSLEEDIYP